MRCSALAALTTFALLAPARSACAEVFEGGLQIGVIDRSLGSADFRTTMNAQLYGDLMVIPKLLGVGVYANGFPAGDRATPLRTSAGELSITALGVRAKAYAPVQWGRLRPYATVGVGRVTAEFPETRGTVCAPTCAEHVAVASTKHFAEVPLGVGLRIDLEGPFVTNFEGGYRVPLGYANDDYERTLGPTPRGGGGAWTFHFALAIAL